MKFNKNLFEKGNETIIANDVKEGMIICLTKNRYFYIEDISKEFINDEVAALYGDEPEKVKPGHTVITFMEEDFNKITNIPGTEPVIAFARINGVHIYWVKPLVDFPFWKYTRNNEFPDDDRVVLNQDAYRCFYQSGNWYMQQMYAVGTIISPNEVIAWCELPVFNKP